MRNRGTTKIYYLAILVLSLAPVALPSPAQAANNVEIGEKTITITVLIELFGGSQELADRWGSAFTKYWNAGPNGQPFKYCGAEALITTDIKVIPTGNYGTRSDYHIVKARPIYDSREEFQPCVRWGMTVGGECPGKLVEKYVSRPHKHNYSGDWEHYINPSKEDLKWEKFSAAHEFGHLLGLEDEYKVEWKDEDHDKVRDFDEIKTVPDLENYPDADQSIMGSKYGRVLQRHIDEVMRKHDVYRRCKLIVDASYGQGNAEFQQTIVLKMELYEEAGGMLIGTGTGLTKWTVSLPNCSGDREIEFDFEVDGTRYGDFVVLTTSPLREGMSDLQCPQAAFKIIETGGWGISADLADGRDEETFSNENPNTNNTVFGRWTIEERLE